MIGVLVPAHNEAASMERCLQSIRRAALNPALGGEAVEVIVALDDCSDATESICAQQRVDTLRLAARCVGIARARAAAELLGRQEVQKLLERVEKDVPKLTEDLVPKTLPLVTLQGVLRGLLEEQVPIRDMRTIIEVITEWAPRMMAGAQPGASLDVGQLIALVRQGLARSITQYWFNDSKECRVIGLDANLERVLDQVVTNNGAMEPGLADKLLKEAGVAVQRQEMSGDPTVLVVPPTLRSAMSRYLRNPFPQLAVLATSEIPDDRLIKVSVVIGA